MSFNDEANDRNVHTLQRLPFNVCVRNHSLDAEPAVMVIIIVDGSRNIGDADEKASRGEIIIHLIWSSSASFNA